MGSVGMIMTRDSSCYPRQLRYAKAGHSQGPSNLGSRGWLDQSVTCTAGYSDCFERTGQSQQREKWSETECTKTRFVGHDVHEGSFPPGRKTPFAPSLSVTILSSEVSQISTFPKFMEELIMPFKRAQVPSQREILSLAEDWGKVVARRAFGDEGPDLDLNFDAIEAVAFQAAQAVIKGTIQQSLSQQMRKLGETRSCPQCRRVCRVETEPRELIVRGATVQYDEPKCHCPTCRRDFFLAPASWCAGSAIKRPCEPVPV